MTEIRTPRLLLRRARRDDLAAMHAVLSDPRAMRYWSTPPHADTTRTETWLESMLAIPPGEGDDFVIECAGVVIGKAGFYRYPEIGFILRSDAWGRGLGREAVGAVLARFFETTEHPAATADVDPRNAASLGLLTGLGFVETGRAAATYEVGGEICDSVYLAARRRDRS